MAQAANKAVNAIETIKARRFSYSAIAKQVLESHQITCSVSHLSRIADGSRVASDELTKALVAASKAMK